MDHERMRDSLSGRQLDPVSPADPSIGREGSATIEVRRVERFSLAKSCEIFLDGRHVASLRRSGPAFLRVQPGPHAVSAKMNWCRSDVVSLDLRPGGRVVLLFGLAPMARRWWRSYVGMTLILIALLILEWFLARLIPDWRGGRAEFAWHGLLCVLLASLCVAMLSVLDRSLPWRTPGSLIALERLDREAGDRAPDLMESSTLSDEFPKRIGESSLG